MATRSAGSVSISFNSITTGVNKGIDEVKGKLGEVGTKAKDEGKKIGEVGKQIGSTLTSIGVGMSVVGVGITGAMGLASSKSATFNKGLAEIQSLIPGTGDRIKELTSNVKTLSKEFGLLPNEAVKGVYDVISAYGDTAETTKILEINVKAAKAGVASLTDSIALTSAVTKTYGDTSGAAQSKVTDLAFTAVKLGQTTFPELASSIGAVTPLAKELTISQEELFAVMGAQTGVTGNASEVATQFRGALSSLMAPTSDLTKLYSSLGFENGKAMVQSLGFKGSIDAIVKASAESGKPLQDYLGSIEGQTLALSLAGANGKFYDTVLSDMSNSAGATNTAFDTLTTGLGSQAFEAEKARAKTELLWIEIGEKLAPIVLDVTGKLNGLLDWGIKFASENPLLVQTIAVLGVAFVVIGTVLTVVGGLFSAIGTIITTVTAVMTFLSPVIAAVGGFFAALSGPVLLVVGVVVALIAVFVLLWQNWDWVVQQISNGWNWFVAVNLAGFEIAKGGFNSFMSFLGGFAKAWQDTWNGVGKFFGGIWDGIANTGKRALNNLTGGINSVIKGFNSISGAVGVPAIPTIPGFANGGIVGNPSFASNINAGDDQIITAKTGELIANQNQKDKLLQAIMNGRGGESGQSQNIQITALDSQSFETYIKKHGFEIKKLLNI